MQTPVGVQLGRRLRMLEKRIARSSVITQVACIEKGGLSETNGVLLENMFSHEIFPKL